MTRRFLTAATTLASLMLVVALAFAGPVQKPQESGGDTSSLEGQPAPDFSFKTLDGKTAKLSEQKGNVVLMDYWATWCPPCREGLPHINELANDAGMKSKGLVVWAINSKEPESKVKPFMKAQNLTMTVPMDSKGEFGKAYLVRGIPTTVVVGRDGIIKKVFVGFGPGQGDAIKEAVEEALKEDSKA